jgi:hypothetical protein
MGGDASQRLDFELREEDFERVLLLLRFFGGDFFLEELEEDRLEEEEEERFEEDEDLPDLLRLPPALFDLPELRLEDLDLLALPDFFPPPSCLFTVRQARSSASPFFTPRLR